MHLWRTHFVYYYQPPSIHPSQTQADRDYKYELKHIDYKIIRSEGLTHYVHVCIFTVGFA